MGLGAGFPVTRLWNDPIRSLPILTSTAGYVSLQNDANARYTLGGLQSGGVLAGQNQSAFAVSMKNTF